MTDDIWTALRTHDGHEGFTATEPSQEPDGTWFCCVARILGIEEDERVSYWNYEHEFFWRKTADECRATAVRWVRSHDPGEV